MLLKRNVMAVALISAGMCFTAAVKATPTDNNTAPANTPATPAAQASAPQDASGPASNDPKKKDTSKDKLAKSLDAITVTGYSKGAEAAIDIQRYADTIQNVVTSADIGGLPDQSIADSLTRLPGVSAERIAGQASQINIRGLSGNFIQTTLDGREQPSTSGSNYIQFDQYPSELINMATVYKSSQASLVTGGVAGTIAMQTADPLQAPKEQNFNLDARGSYDGTAHDVSGANALGYRLSAAYQGKFLDDTLGVGLGVAQMYQPHVAEQFVGEASDGAVYKMNSSANSPSGYLPEGIQLQQNGGEERRTGEVATIVWKPTDELKFTGDGFYSKFDNESFGYGLRSQNFYGNNAQITNPVFSSLGTLIGGTVSSNPTGVGGNQFSNETTADNYSTTTNVLSGGLNMKWDHDRWHVDADVSLSRATSNDINVDTTADPYSGLGTANPQLMPQSVTYMLKGGNIGTASFANPGLYTNLNDMGLSRYGVYPYIYHDKMKAFRTSVKYDLPDSSWLSALEAGVYLNNHNYEADREAYVYGSEWNTSPVAGEPPLSIPAADAKVTCWKGQFSGLPCFLTLNAPAILAAHGITANPVKDINTQNWTYVQSGTVEEKTHDLFFMADIDAQVFGHELTGNVGVRVSHQSQYSNGLQQVGNGAGIPITDGNGYTSDDFAPLTVGKTYTDYLPSLNLIYHLTDDDQMRFSAAKVLSRPPIDQMLAGAGSYITNGQYNVYGGTSPLLNPLRATQYDLDYEHYFDDSSGALTAGVFFKDVKSFIQQVTYNNYDFAAAGITVPIDPTTGVPYQNGEFQTAYNAKGGLVRGLELSGSKTHFLPGIWSGLGVDGNFALTSSTVRNPTTLGGPTTYVGLPGLSKRVASMAVFYDYGPFSARLSGNYRSAFLSDTQLSVTNQLVTFAGETVFDFQASYNVTKQLSVVYQLLNLSNQPTRTYFGGNPQQTGTIQYFGRTSYVGLNLKL
ncbi:TonB-dependent receptor [Rhodanobacter sp. A1T4]|jgi:iron complex outermembrane receptor protein|uniref:TonB-dependent receptor n=1 Tax=Rhodanobacter sp. A1T4 TaxID=2723087 RepID=UPI00160E0D46|nr:TonB-dependent receptor [Rhodanobacter sp. A1T4]MBB6246209.1 phosphoribosylformimino-5-aminoimidazole carboxamide ribotide isomerase [Rhodanobacter sp. A1T4]